MVRKEQLAAPCQEPWMPERELQTTFRRSQYWGFLLLPTVLQ